MLLLLDLTAVLKHEASVASQQWARKDLRRKFLMRKYVSHCECLQWRLQIPDLRTVQAESASAWQAESL